MSPKPTYEELERRVKELEKESFMQSQTEKAMLESEEEYRKLEVLSAKEKGKEKRVTKGFTDSLKKGKT